MTTAPQIAWVCPVCGYVHYGPEPPEFCPVCDAPGEMFEREEAPAPVQAEEAGGRKVVIIGAGIAGVSAVEALHRVSPHSEILLVGRENRLPYYRLNLTRYLAGEIGPADLPIHPAEWYTEQNATFLPGVEVKLADPVLKSLVLSDGSTQAYDRLLITAGANPFIPPIPGANRSGVVSLRTVSDADRILEVCRPSIHCVCIGGGILGLETAGALAARGARVTVLESAGWLLPRQLNQHAGDLLEVYACSLGIALRKSVQIAEISGEERAQGVLLKDGTLIPAELVVISAGVRSDLTLARQAGLKVNQGIVVDNRMETSQPDVFAAGDVAEHAGVMYGIWGPAQLQGMVAGTNAGGGQAEFRGVPRSNVLKVLGYDLLSIGQIQPDGASDAAVSGDEDGRYYHFVFREGCLVGSILMADTSAAGAVKKAVENRLDCTRILQKSPSASQVLEFLRESA